MPKARLFFLQSSIAGCQSRQGPLALATGKSSSPTSLESVFPVASLSGLTVNPVAEKYPASRYEIVPKGKTKNSSNLKFKAYDI